MKRGREEGECAGHQARSSGFSIRSFLAGRAMGQQNVKPAGRVEPSSSTTPSPTNDSGTSSAVPYSSYSIEKKLPKEEDAIVVVSAGDSTTAPEPEEVALAAVPKDSLRQFAPILTQTGMKPPLWFAQAKPLESSKYGTKMDSEPVLQLFADIQHHFRSCGLEVAAGQRRLIAKVRTVEAFAGKTQNSLILQANAMKKYETELREVEKMKVQIEYASSRIVQVVAALEYLTSLLSEDARKDLPPLPSFSYSPPTPSQMTS